MLLCFFFQAEDGIRDYKVTGVQTCALPISHAKALRAIATAPQKSDAVDARLLARMLLSGLIPEAYPRSADQRELLRLLRHRTALVRFRTRLAGRIHSQLHQQRLSLPREKLLRRATRAWLEAA